MKQLITILIIILILVAGFTFAPEYMKPAFLTELSETEHDDDDDDDDEVNTRQQLVDGKLQVRIEKETQQLAGIRTSLAENISVRSENRAFATVIDIKEIIDLRASYRNVAARREVINTNYRNASKLLEQLKVLHKEARNISARELQEAQSSWEEYRARMRAADVELQNIRATMVQKWNTEITDMALKDDSEIFNRLTQREEFIILVTLKAEQQLDPNTAFVFVNRIDDRMHARKAYFISPAPFSDSTLQGETYFFRTNADKIRIGMRLYVWLPGTGFTGQGVNIPEEAIVWYAGKPWAYVQVDDELFSRRSLIDAIEVSGSWLVKENFDVGEKVVTSGAQTLLSEEFKWAIPDEDDD
ncbi:MAG: hypothetical protein HND53_10140 [Proteobacteria bacterium]|nr:hypothetical protein [Pseudomonadota bacterium]NOG60849.1 hypothetical protein [Pseudomonadota bacterium]